VLILASALATLIAAIVVFGLEPTDERTQLLFREPQGAITSGAQFGVTIGEPWADADAALRARFTPDDVQWSIDDGSRISREPVLVGDAQVAYRDRSWRNGVVALDVSDGVVTAVHWRYDGPFYLDL
jgi:hypothetical protein